MHHHPVDLSGRVHRWRAAPHALPALIRDHHNGTPADRRDPSPPEDPNNGPGPAILGWAVAVFVVYAIIAVIYGLWIGGRA
ncbi:hypothetical protein [Sphingomonas paucimobilis]|uniref:hypothetical protein n=1 Tax=Sphingomonas paucimobilis TaxID=13689 RepID=UPI00064BDF34|nr:hypothetical protein [Sphingomonas paucimobilis]